MNSLRTTTAAVLVSLLALAACGSDESSDDAASASTETASTEPTTTEAPATAPVDTEPPVTEPPATEPTATEPPPTEPAATAAPATEPPADGPECLVGDWVITEAEMNAYYDALEAALAAESGAAPTIDVSGDVGIRFTPTEYTYTGDFDLTLAVAGQEGTGSSAGVVTGTWSGADGVIVTELTESSLTVSVSIGGITLDGSDLANGLLNDLPINAAPYDCDGPSIDFQTGIGTPRHTVRLTPA